MNERIKELAEQANRYALDKANEGEDEDFDYSFDDDFQEKFAELIVKECYVALFPALRDMISRGQAYDLIKQHFGVE
jgi:hypothetical protein